MGSEEVVAYLIFGSYFGLILLSGLFVGKSLLDDIKPLKLLESRPFLLLRIAVAALGCTWYCELRRQYVDPELTLDSYDRVHEGELLWSY